MMAKNSKAKAALRGNEKQVEKRSDALYWVVASFLLLVGMGGNVLYSDVAFAVRLALDLILLCLLIAVLLPTRLVKSWRGYVMQAWMELHRVTWPSAAETKGATIMVVVVVTLVSILLWVLDSLLIQIVKWFV